MQFNPAIDLVAPRPIHQAKNNKPLACVRQGLVARHHLCVCGGEMIRKATSTQLQLRRRRLLTMPARAIKAAVPGAGT